MSSVDDSIYQLSAKKIDGEELALKGYQGKVVLVVNTASQCGFTSQFEQLESLYKQFNEQGFEILGFPCNQFGSQDPADNKEIMEFCQLNYGVTFPMFEKIEVNGDDAHPLFKYLKGEAKGFAGTKSIKWNFTKFLIDQNGNVLKRYAPKDKPEKLANDIKKLLAS